MDNGVETRFVYDGWRVVEERDAQDNVLASYVHDGYIDDVVSMRSTVLGGDPRDWFFHSDDQFSVVLLTDDEGDAVERVGYDAWGTPTFQRVANGATASVSFFGNPYAFTGRRWDATERVYHYRLRTFDPAIGRFTTRDPIGIWGDLLNLGNGYTYTGNAPWSWLDPFGLQGWSLWGDRPQLGDRCKTLVNDGTVPDYGNDFGMRRAEAITGLMVDTYEHARHAEAVGEEIAKEGIQYAAEEAATGPIPVATIRRVGRAADRVSDAVRATDKVTDGVRIATKTGEGAKSAERQVLPAYVDLTEKWRGGTFLTEMLRVVVIGMAQEGPGKVNFQKAGVMREFCMRLQMYAQTRHQVALRKEDEFLLKAREMASRSE